VFTQRRPRRGMRAAPNSMVLYPAGAIQRRIAAGAFLRYWRTRQGCPGADTPPYAAALSIKEWLNST